jgi:nitrate reductase delta subunit
MIFWAVSLPILMKITMRRSFVSEIEKMGVTDLEEFYTRTFDINPVSALEIGWHLYGEQYERGAFLVKMRELSRTLGVEESTSLPHICCRA